MRFFVLSIVIILLHPDLFAQSRPAGSSAVSAANINNIINEYTPVLAFNPCANKITVEDASKYNTGDTVLMIQMKGAAIDSTNTIAFGTITDYKGAGNYEFNYVKSKSGNIIELKNKLTRQYEIPAGKVQLVRVPYYSSATVTGTLTCLPWDGSKGGVLVLNTRDTIILNANVDVSGKGFRGGKALNSGIFDFQPACSAQTYYTPNTATAKQEKGEGIAEVSVQKISGRGSLANGGGGANLINSGGGGGSNGTAGGKGGDQYQDCNSTPDNVGGLAGKPLTYSAAINKIFLGGGGGAGDANDPNGSASFNPDGGNGGGLIIIKSNYIRSNTFSIIANGDNGKFCTNNCKEGMGGGGAGGTVLLDINNFISPVNAVTGKGGNGSDNVNHIGFNHGPGGGGSGGVLFVRNASQPAAITSNLAGGLNGISQNSPNVTWGALPGNAGQTIFNLQLPFTTVLFKSNIDSVRIKDSSTACRAFNFSGLGYTNTSAIASWNWYFGDGGTASTQNTSHNYTASGTFPVKLVVTDINGCKDSIIKNINSSILSVNAGNDSSFCSNSPVAIQLAGTGAGTFSWSPAIYLNNSTIQNPIATINTTTTFHLTVTNINGCTGKDSVTFIITPAPILNTLVDTAICKGSLLILNTTAGFTNYHWSPGILVSDSAIANPAFIGAATSTLIITGTTGTCIARDTITVTVNPLPLLTVSADTVICSSQTVALSASGASWYSWSPSTFLSNPSIANPVFMGNLSTTYYLTGTGANGCQAKDTVTIFVNAPGSLIAPMDKSFCLNQSVQLNGSNGNSYQYLWSPATYLSSSTVLDPIANPPASTTYTVKITDLLCNVDSIFVVNVIVNPLPSINATSSNDIDCNVRTSRLNVTGASQYLWAASPSLSSTVIANPIASPSTGTLYIVTGTDNLGCQSKDSVYVAVNSGGVGYLLPNSFTPNGDGTNDCFGIKHWGTARELVFIIYSRWGEKVFETDNVNICWDGKYKGQPANAGTYVYYVSASTPCGKMVKKGNVLLIR